MPCQLRTPALASLTQAPPLAASQMPVELPQAAMCWPSGAMERLQESPASPELCQLAPPSLESWMSVL